MSAVLEQTAEELTDLIGATIEAIWIREPAGKYEQPTIRLLVSWRKDLIVNGRRSGEFEIWQDVEGNGPGYLAFVEPDDA